MITELPMPSDKESAPGYFFPGWLPRCAKERTLAYLQKEHMTLIDEQEYRYIADTASSLHTAAFSFDLLVLVESILELPYLEILLADYKSIVYCTPNGVPTAIQLHGKKNRHHTTRWIIQASAWQQFTPDGRLLTRLRTLFEHCGVGVANTPGALGLLLQKWAFRDQYGDDWYQHRHPLPPLRCVEDLRQNSTGARSDLFVEATQMFDTVYELDLKNGYGAAFVEQPAGHAIPHQGRFLEQYASYVSRCVVTLKDRLILGCFPIRAGEGDQATISYPTEPGVYAAFLWKEEIDLVRKKGGLVETGPGWGWLETTQDNRRWVELMTELRDTASETIVDWVKLAIVASIGRHGSPWESCVLVSDEEHTEGDLEAAWNGLCYDWYVHKAMLHIPESMQHWFSYTLMQCRLLLYKHALPYAEKEQLLATNVDGLYVSEDADVEDVVAKEDAIGMPSGTLRKQILHDVQFPALRHLKSREKVRRPGIPKQQK